MKGQLTTPVEVWGGLECTINRVNDQYFDQLDVSGHYHRDEDISRIAELGIKKVRYPVLWEKHQPVENAKIDWTQTAHKLSDLRSHDIDVIAGLVHHGSGPLYVHMPDDSFALGLADYAEKVAIQFPWIEYYTPVNEPLTTARFCGLYGVWYPHQHDDQSFCRILVNECKATVLAMQAIRKVNPNAKLVQTDDLGKTHSTPLLKYQADFENHRRWLSYDLLCGMVSPSHPLWNYLVGSGVSRENLEFFANNSCPPDIIGINHYLTSERYLDQRKTRFPKHTYGGNGTHSYADVEAVRIGNICPEGPKNLIKEAWERYHLPIAITEVHLYCTREEQMRWLYMLWNTANELKNEGVDIKAITPWALFGSFGWNRLLTSLPGDYEPGVFDLTGSVPRKTALGGMIESFSKTEEFRHPLLETPGWWQRECRVAYGAEAIFNGITAQASRPLLIVGKSGTMATAFAKACDLRGISYVFASHTEADITNPTQLESFLLKHSPWAVVNTASFGGIDDAELSANSCYAINTFGAENLAILCSKYDIKLLTFSTDMVFDGIKTTPYVESDCKTPLNVFGQSKDLAEEKILQHNSNALIIRTAAFFGPWGNSNFITAALSSIKEGKNFEVINDVLISPTYLPDLVQTSLDLMIDDEAGIWHLSNKGQISWADLAYTAAELSGLKTRYIKPKPLDYFRFKAQRPRYSALLSERGNLMPVLDDALTRYLSELV
jgi:dTDP-4-dehydrorhamnose reductase